MRKLVLMYYYLITVHTPIFSIAPLMSFGVIICPCPYKHSINSVVSLHRREVWVYKHDHERGELRVTYRDRYGCAKGKKNGAIWR